MTDTPQQADTGGVAAERLRSFVERIERLEEEKNAISEDISDLYKEAKESPGEFKPKVLRRLIRRRRKNPDKLREQDELLKIYTSITGPS